jgi:predicted nucleic acid-binding protein
MDRLFLDANVLFSASYHPGAGLLQIWKLKNVELCSSRYALAEADVNLGDVVQRKRLAGLAEKLQFFEAPQRELPRGISLPEKDAPILLAAIAARATYLLTGDVRDFGLYFGKKIEGVMIVLPGEYLRTRSNRSDSSTLSS